MRPRTTTPSASRNARTRFHPFKLDVAQLHLQPGEREIIIHNLHTNEQDTLASEVGLKEQRLEDYIVHALVDFDDIDYFTHADLFYDLREMSAGHITPLRQQT